MKSTTTNYLRRIIQYYQLSWLRKLATVIRSLKADVSSVSPSSLAMKKDSRSKRQLWNSLRRLIYGIKSVDDTKLPCFTLPPTQHYSLCRNLLPLLKRALRFSVWGFSVIAVFRFWPFFRSGFQFLCWITGFLILVSVSVCGFSFFWQLVFGLRKKCLPFFGFYILFGFSGMVTAVLRISGDESRVMWGPISWSSFWALIWCKWLKSLELASWIWA